MTDMSRELATATEWWVEQLPKRKPNLAVQAGAQADDLMAHPVAMGMFERLAEKEAETITPERVEAFKEALVPILQREVDKRLAYWAESAMSGFNVVVATDYGPDHLLGEALEGAGLNGRSMTLLPNKTVMWIKPGSVSVSAGYGAAVEEVPLLALASREQRAPKEGTDG